FVLMSHGGEAVMVSNGFEVVAKVSNVADFAALLFHRESVFRFRYIPIACVPYGYNKLGRGLMLLELFEGPQAKASHDAQTSQGKQVVLNYVDVETDNLDVRDRVYAANKGDMEATLHRGSKVGVSVRLGGCFGGDRAKVGAGSGIVLVWASRLQERLLKIRIHSQKYFLKVQKSGTNEPVSPPRRKRKAAHPYTLKAKKGWILTITNSA
ncbi:hypothetical protein Tco_0576702, partial [Tanacetum coccineum]